MPLNCTIHCTLYYNEQCTLSKLFTAQISTNQSTVFTLLQCVDCIWETARGIGFHVAWQTLHCTLMHWLALYCTALYYNALHCTEQYGSIYAVHSCCPHHCQICKTPHCNVSNVIWVHCGLCNMLYIVCRTPYAVSSVQCPVCSVQCTMCSVQCAVCSVQCTMCSVQCAVCCPRHCQIRCLFGRPPVHSYVQPAQPQVTILHSTHSTLHT